MQPKALCRTSAVVAAALQLVLGGVDKRQAGIVLENLVLEPLGLLLAVVLYQIVTRVKRAAARPDPALGQVAGALPGVTL